MRTRIIALIAGGAALAATPATAQQNHWLKGFKLHDLSHPIPMFREVKGKGMLAPDLKQPFKNSKPVASFGFEGVRRVKPHFKTKTGHFTWGYFSLDEHYSTHIDSTNHYQNNKTSLKGKPDNRTVDQYSVQELFGPVVYIDVSARVTAELAKNGGRPSPDRKKVNFDNMVTVADIDKVKDQITNGVWIVINTGWSKFFEGAPPKNPFLHPYVNGLNYPGLNKPEVERLIAIEEEKGVKIAGIIVDNLSVDSGQSGRGPDGNPFGTGWYVHQMGLQRGWKLVENATNLGALASYQPGQCAIFIGAPKVVSATGAPARILAMCRNNQ